jgi:4-methyl-5(b-hydroxyethyl)-thiazole monophosphate biosynthesis
MIKKAIVLLAEGFEEVEAVTPIDYMRRAGIEVTIAALAAQEQCDGLPVLKGSRGIQVNADTFLGKLLPKAADWDAVVAPGGLKGAENLAACKTTGAFLKDMAAAGKLACAICAAPALVFSPLGLLAGKKYTCYPGMEERVKDKTAIWSEDRVVTDGNIITSRGAGTAGEFATAIINKLLGEETGKKIAASVLL